MTPAKDTNKRAWYTAVPIGKNTSCGVVKTLCAKAGLETRSNHSLCATAATALFKANVPEKINPERTDHCSLDSVRLYEHSTERQQGAGSKILAISSDVDYQKALCAVASEKALAGSSMAHTASLSITLNIQSMSGWTINVSYATLLKIKQEDSLAQSLPELSENRGRRTFQ